MTSDRAISTPLDVAVGLLLVAAAIAVVSGIPGQTDPGDSVKQSGSAILGQTIEVSMDSEDGARNVSGSMGGIVGDAVIASRPPRSTEDRRFRQAVEEAVTDELSRIDVPLQVVSYCREVDHRRPLVVGAAPPPEQPVTTQVYTLPRADRLENDSGERCQPMIAVRRWER